MDYTEKEGVTVLMSRWWWVGGVLTNKDCDDLLLSSLLEGLMFGPADNFILQFGTQVDKIIAVTGNTDDKVAVLPRILLGFLQGFGADDIELDMMAIQFEIGPDQKSKLV
jgi:hypothetical protein